MLSTILCLVASVLFLSAAAICKAVADTLTHHFGTSIFKDKNPAWWNPNESWKHVPFLSFWIFKTKYRADAWHLANSGMIACFILSSLSNPLLVTGVWWAALIVNLALLGVYGGIFILVFNLYYDKLLKK